MDLKFKLWIENIQKDMDSAGGVPMRLQYSGINAQSASVPEIISALKTLGIDVPENVDPVRFAAMVKRAALDMNTAGPKWQQLINPED
jgi:hypothetical protein